MSKRVPSVCINENCLLTSDSKNCAVSIYSTLLTTLSFLNFYHNLNHQNIFDFFDFFTNYDFDDYIHDFQFKQTKLPFNYL